jgi:hypothetical protein
LEPHILNRIDEEVKRRNITGEKGRSRGRCEFLRRLIYEFFGEELPQTSTYLRAKPLVSPVSKPKKASRIAQVATPSASPIPTDLPGQVTIPESAMREYTGDDSRTSTVVPRPAGVAPGDTVRVNYSADGNGKPVGDVVVEKVDKAPAKAPIPYTPPPGAPDPYGLPKSTLAMACDPKRHGELIEHILTRVTKSPDVKNLWAEVARVFNLMTKAGTPGHIPLRPISANAARCRYDRYVAAESTTATATKGTPTTP